MRSIITWIVTWLRPDRRSLSELADFLAKRKKAASWWDHSHITRRLATKQDAEEYQALSADKRFVLLQAARFCSSYYAVAMLPALTFGFALIFPLTLKLADSAGIPIELQVSFLTAVAGVLIVLGVFDLYGASKSAAHAKTWVAAFEDMEKKCAVIPQTSPPWWKWSRQAPTP